MTDWEVKVITHNNQVKDVRVNDCIYPDDAVRAAISQTAGKQMISCQAVYDQKSYSSLDTTETFYDETYYIPPQNWRENDTYEYWIGSFLQVAIVPTIILICINPLLAILFCLAFGWWWFHDLKCDT